MPEDAEKHKTKQANLIEEDDREGSGKENNVASAYNEDEEEDGLGQNYFQIFFLSCFSSLCFHSLAVRCDMHRTLHCWLIV